MGGWNFAYISNEWSLATETAVHKWATETGGLAEMLSKDFYSTPTSNCFCSDCHIIYLNIFLTGKVKKKALKTKCNL